MYTFVDLSSLVTNREGKAQRILYSVKMCNTYMSSRFTPACATRALKQRCFTLVREFFLLVPLLSKGKMLRYKLLHQCNHGKKYPNQNIENIVTFSSFTVFENHRKSLIQHCERSELRLQKLIKNTKNGQFWRVFEKLKLAVKQCYQTGQF